MNCNKLESISIGKYSFSDYSGEFELLNLPELQSISIGDMNSNSYNFYSASLFEINSNIIIKVCNIDMPNLESVILGAYSFHSVLEIVFDGRNIFKNSSLDLPKLKSIELGSLSLFGQWGNSNCKLTMKGITYTIHFHL